MQNPIRREIRLANKVKAKTEKSEKDASHSHVSCPTFLQKKPT